MGRSIQSDSSAQFIAVENGILDITLSAWKTVPDLTNAAPATGKVQSYGPTGGKVVEGWWYTKELLKFCPGLAGLDRLQKF